MNDTPDFFWPTQYCIQ